MKTIIMAALLITSGFAAAQDAPVPAAPPDSEQKAGEVKQLDKDIHADKKAIKADKKALKASRAAQRSQMKDIDAQEKAAVAGIKADSSKSDDEKKAAIAKLRTDYRDKRHEVSAHFADQRKVDRAAIGSDRKDMSNDKQQRRDIQHDKK
jgi:hypothetical protein